MASLGKILSNLNKHREDILKTSDESLLKTSDPYYVPEHKLENLYGKGVNLEPDLSQKIGLQPDTEKELQSLIESARAGDHAAAADVAVINNLQLYDNEKAVRVYLDDIRNDPELLQMFANFDTDNQSKMVNLILKTEQERTLPPTTFLGEERSGKGYATRAGGKSPLVPGANITENYIKEAEILKAGTLKKEIEDRTNVVREPVSYTHLTLPTIYSV